MTTTDNQIQTLCNEAAEAGDRAQVYICRVALGETSEDVGEDMRLSDQDQNKVRLFESRVAAREECARVISRLRDAEAQ